MSATLTSILLELSWSSATPLEQDSTIRDDTYSPNVRSRSPNDTNGIAPVPTGIQRPSVDTIPAKIETTATPMPLGPSDAAEAWSLDGEGCSTSLSDSTSSTSTSQSSSHSFHSQPHSLRTHLHRGHLPHLDFSTLSPRFPSVPPLSDDMIDALTDDLERDYLRTLHIRQASSVSSSNSSASTSWSDLFEASSQTSADSECTTPDIEWSPRDSDWMALGEQTPSAADAKTFTVRLVSPKLSPDLDCLPVLNEWEASSDGSLAPLQT